MKIVKQRFEKSLLLICSMLISALVLLFCSKSSPLYPMNDWVDVHCFLTLGKGLLNGMIPYVDLYEQKGPVLYFIYAIVALFSQKSMIGQYLLEVVTFGLFLYFSAKLAGIYLGQQSKYLYPIMGVLAAAIASTTSFCHGGSVEQMCLFMFLYGLYSVLKACHEGLPLTFRAALTNGIFAGMVLWIKYTMLGFYIGLAVFVLIWYLVRIRDLKKLLAVIGQFLLGIGIVSAVVLIFFLCAGGLKELYTCYFYNNIFLYSDDSSGFSFIKIWYSLRSAMSYNLVFPTFVLMGFGWLLFRGRKLWSDALAVGLTFSCLTIFTFMAHSYAYYSLVLSAFTVFGLVGAAWLIREAGLSKLLHKLTCGSSLVSAMLITAFILLCTTQAFRYSSNTYLLKYEREELPQYRFAEIISETEDATLLNFGFLDGGFYYAADVLPNCPFFCSFNVQAPNMWETQYEYIREEKVDFVVTRQHTLERYGIDSSAYELVDTADMYFEGVDFTYYLYKLKGDAQ